ncbi:MAG: hypothetical protein IKU03_09080 [Bacteroidales bacterium]|nr:hypothetical protein [Bacteroidales bacterium]
MKYIFGVSSHLTFYIAHRIIELNHFDRNECLLFQTRNYSLPDNYNAQYPHQVHTGYNLTNSKSGRVFAGANIFKTIRNIREFDALIDPFLQNDDFFYYTQVCSNDITSLMATKKNCLGFYVIEDGLASYRDFNPQTFTGIRYVVYKTLLNPFFNRIYACKNHFIASESPKFKGCIATLPFCFPLHQDKLQVIGLPYEIIDLGFTPDALLSIDPLYLHFSKEEIMQIYTELGHFIKDKQYKTIAFKYHPNFFAAANTEIRLFFERTIRDILGESMIELDKSVVLENVLKTYRCDFYTDNSSVALYGSQMGAKCYTYKPIMRKYAHKEKFEEWYPTIPVLEKAFLPVGANNQ